MTAASNNMVKLEIHSSFRGRTQDGIAMPEGKGVLSQKGYEKVAV
jgi:hypothetical protein